MVSLERIALVVIFGLFITNAVFAADEVLVKTGGRAPARNLQIKKSKVPTYQAFKSKDIPRLDIGEEPTFKFNASGLALPANPAMVRMSPHPMPNVLPIEIKKNLVNVEAVGPVSASKFSYPAPTNTPVVNEVANPTVTATNPETKKVTELTSPEKQLLEAQILLETQKKPEVALGLVTEILNDKKVKTEAEITYAVAAQTLGLDSEFRSTLMHIAQENSPKWSKKATELLVSQVQALDISHMKELHELVTKYDIDTDKNDAYNFYRAKYFLEKGDLGQVEYALSNIPEKSKYRIDALLIGALSLYRSNQIGKAATQLEMLLQEAPEDSSLRSIGAITLARIQFQIGEYGKASETYKKVSKSSSLFLQAMTEQAWSQILNNDYEGAAGNMFSLHTDFFKNAFAPESYTARSVAYLNLCQFGDGLQALNNFKKKYGPFVERLSAYQGKYQSRQDDYETVRALLKNPDVKEVNGLPRSFVFEMARHPSFTKAQTQINNFEDEIEKFNKVNLGLIQLEKDLIKKQSEAREDMAKAKAQREAGGGSVAELKARTDGLEQQIASLKYQYELTKKSRNWIKDARTRAQSRIDKEKVVLKEVASKSLRTRLNELTKDVSHILEQNEVLEYEIMAGAGEHLREQSAGAQAKKVDAPSRMPASEKNVKWSFKGEIWEDEIGHYRSSLKNVCTGSDDKIASH